MKDAFNVEFHPTEMYKLINLLVATKIPFEVRELWDTPQICYPSRSNLVCDVICHRGSYGHEKGLLELMGLTIDPDDVEGYLTAEDVFDRISQHWRKTQVPYAKGFAIGAGGERWSVSMPTWE